MARNVVKKVKPASGKSANPAKKKDDQKTRHDPRLREQADKVVEKSKYTKIDSSRLREQADKLLSGQHISARALSDLSGKSMEYLIHELQVHQIELKMQNDELRKTYERLTKINEKFVDLYDFSPVGYITLTVKNVIAEANLTFAQMLGVERKSIIGGVLSKYIYKDDHKIFYSFMLSFVKEKKIGTCVLRLVGRNGEAFYCRLDVLIKGNPALDAREINITDINDLIRAEHALLKAKSELEERVDERTSALRALANRLTQTEQVERKRLAGVLHDNLQQLLVGAKWNMQTIKDKLKNNNELRITVDHALEMVDLSIKTSKSLAMELAPPILYEAGLGAGIRWLGRWMEEKYGLVTEIDADIAIMADNLGICVMLFRVVQELLLNVTKHSGVKEARVSVKKDDRNIKVEVSDWGIGFDPEKMYEQADMEGFGLFSIRERIKYIGGEMTIESGPDKGTLITILAPMPSAEKEIGDIPPVIIPDEKTGGTITPNGCNKIRVLVVDDHRIVREGICGLLSSVEDIEVIGEADDGEEAVIKARELRPEIIIMDVNMEKMNGIEATRQIKAEMPEIKVIGLSMYEESELSREMKTAGAVAFVHKAGPSEDLIGSILANHRAG